MSQNEELTSHILNEEEDKYEEEWEVIMTTKGKYTLSKVQALGLKQAISQSRGVVIFQTFAIGIPYIVEFYRVKRFLKDTYKLPKRATEEEYKPIDPEKWQKMKRELYRKLGKKI